MMNQLLPVGSVITLTGAEKKLMIVGIAVQKEDEERIYDYIGVPFPEGYIDDETMFLFSHKDIAEMHFLGYVNAEAQLYRADLHKNMVESGIIQEDASQFG